MLCRGTEGRGNALEWLIGLLGGVVMRPPSWLSSAGLQERAEEASIGIKFVSLATS